ncbi:MAG: hypothetical protein ACREF8_01710 [Chthoniobacterales bacterium]
MNGAPRLCARDGTPVSRRTPRVVNAHATMLAYNDIYRFLLKLPAVALVLLLIAPRDAFPKATK